MSSQISFGLSVAVIGILVVFGGLILLIFCLKLIELISVSKPKQTVVEAKPEPAVAKAPVQPVVTEGISPEIIAAITAAVSAVWQEETGFVVRRVRRIHNASAWNVAGRDDQIYSRL